MKNFVKKHTVGILAVILLTAIVVLSVAAFAPKKDETLTDDRLDDTSKVTPIIPDEKNEIPLYTQTLPKSSSPSEKYLFEQTVCGNGNIRLAAALQTVSATYIIAETDCKSGDVASDKKTVGIVKTDSLGNIEKSICIQNNRNFSYVASNITNDGIVIIVADDTKSYLFVTVTDYNLTETVTEAVPYAENAKIFPLNDCYLVFLDNGQETFVLQSSKDGFDFSSFSLGEIVDVFDYGNYFKIFYNATDGYGISDLSKTDFTVNKTIFVSSATLNCIIPFVENGKQIYLAAESDSGLYIRKFYSDLSPSSSDRKKIGSATLLGHGADNTNMYLCLTGGINGIVTVRTNLTLSYSLNKTTAVISKIYDRAFDNNTFTLLVSDGDGKSVTIKISENGSETSYYDATDNAALLAYPNGTFGIAYNSSFYDYSAIKIIGLG